MIVTFDQIKDMTDTEVRELSRICHDHNEMFCLMLNEKDHVRRCPQFETREIMNRLKYVTVKLSMVPDMILMQKLDGTFMEVKNRWHSYGRVKLVLEEVVNIVTKVVIDE